MLYKFRCFSRSADVESQSAANADVVHKDFLPFELNRPHIIRHKAEDAGLDAVVNHSADFQLSPNSGLAIAPFDAQYLH